MDSDDEIEGGENDVNNDWSAPPTRTIPRWPLCYRLSAAQKHATHDAHTMCCARCSTAPPNARHMTFSQVDGTACSCQHCQCAVRCSECKRVGDLLCCDGCENAYHGECLIPAVDPETLPVRSTVHCTHSQRTAPFGRHSRAAPILAYCGHSGRASAD